MNGKEIEQVEKIMETHVKYIQKDISRLELNSKESTKCLTEKIDKVKSAVHALQRGQDRRAGIIGAIVSAVISSIFAGLTFWKR